jgi:hypothetical protein
MKQMDFRLETSCPDKSSDDTSFDPLPYSFVLSFLSSSSSYCLLNLLSLSRPIFSQASGPRLLSDGNKLLDR